MARGRDVSGDGRQARGRFPSGRPRAHASRMSGRERSRAEAYSRLTADTPESVDAFSGGASAGEDPAGLAPAPGPRPSRSARHSQKRGRSRASKPDAASAVRRGGGRHAAPKPARERRQGRWGQVAAGLLLVLVLLAVAGTAVARYLLYHPEVEVAAGQPVHISVPQGATTAEIGEVLASAGVVDSVLMFRYKAREAGVDGDLKPGEYDLFTGMPYEAVLEKLIAGPPIVTVDVTIPEGFTARQVAERFAAQAGVPGEELLALVTAGAPEFVAEHPYLEGAYGGSLEGFLFPATYTVKPGISAHDVVERLLDTFDEQATGLDLSLAQSRGLDLADVVTIASILEREAQRSEEFPLVSSVIYNRLAKPMRLQLCATVLYTMPPGTTSLTNDDLDEDSPYNTYIHDGLPVGPISNPGLAALTAAAAPAQTDYYYYVLTGADGSQTFTKTYDEFLRAKASSEVIGN